MHVALFAFYFYCDFQHDLPLVRVNKQVHFEYSVEIRYVHINIHVHRYQWNAVA